jgi:hypothetical protein
VAFSASKHATVIGEIGASLPPAMTTSAAPSSSSCAAYPTASRPDVQPVDTTATGPSAAHAHATSAAMLLGSIELYACREV